MTTLTIATRLFGVRLVLGNGAGQQSRIHCTRLAAADQYGMVMAISGIRLFHH